MPVKIRLRRVGRKKQPSYRIVVADSRTPRDGAYVDAIGFYNPRRTPAELRLDMESLDDWLNKGAQPTDTVASLIRKARRGGDAKVAFLKEEERPPVTAAVAESVSAASEAASAPVPEAAPAAVTTEASAAEAPAVEEAAPGTEPEAQAPARQPAKPGSKGSGEARAATPAPEAEVSPAPEAAETEESAAAPGGAAEAEEKPAE